jgi:hypothetical protein
MAVIKPVYTDVSETKDGSTIQISWTPVTSADTCGIVSLPRHTDRSIQVSGNFGATASVAVNGSNELGGTNVAALNDQGGAAIAITLASIKFILENTLFVQPAATGGGGAQSLTISLLSRMSNPLRT